MNILSASLFVLLSLATLSLADAAQPHEQVAAAEAKAAAGDTDAMISLAVYWLQNAPEEEAKSRALLQQAADAGQATAAFILAGIQEKAGEVETSQKNYARAYELYSQHLTSQPQDAETLFWLGLMQTRGMGTTTNTDAGLSRMDQAAALGSTTAAQNLFKLYMEGKDIPKDETRALQYAQQLADKGDALMAFLVADAYLKGQGLPNNIELGEQYLEQAAHGNVPDAIALKAVRLEEAGKQEQALPLYQQAASMGQEYATLRLGMIQIKGEGVEQDTAAGLALLERASERYNIPRAAYELALYYDSINEPALANQWYASASLRGVKEAMARRALLHITPSSGLNWSPTEFYKWLQAGHQAGDATCTLYRNLFLFGFIPLFVTLVFLLPIIIVVQLNKRAEKKNAALQS